MRLREIRKFVEDIVASGGGGGGLVVGPWEPIDFGAWPSNGQTVDVPAVEVASEIEIMMGTVPGNDDLTYRVDNADTSEALAMSIHGQDNTYHLRTLVPAGANLTVIRFGNDGQDASVYQFRRRTLG